MMQEKPWPDQKGLLRRDRTEWGFSAAELRRARADLEATGAIVRDDTGAYGWGEPVDATSRAILTLATGVGWTVRGLLVGRAHLISSDGQRELALDVEFGDEGPRVIGGVTGDGQHLGRLAVLEYLGGTDAAGE